MYPKRIMFSFKYAYEGVSSVAFVGIFLATFFRISLTQWIVCIMVWSLDFSLELTNTAIEDVVDSFTKDHHPGAKRAKDVAAAAVMVAFLAEAAIGLIIFLPHFVALFI
jgi:diacylglycerol kinase